MHQNDQRKINFSKIYNLLSNFEMENAWLKHPDGSKCDRIITRKINRANQIKLRKRRLIKLMSVSLILKFCACWFDVYLKNDSTDLPVDPKIYFAWYSRYYMVWNACSDMQRCNNYDEYIKLAIQDQNRGVTFILPWSRNLPPIGRYNKHETLSSVIDISSCGRWNNEVSECQLSTNALSIPWFTVV